MGRPFGYGHLDFFLNTFIFGAFLGLLTVIAKQGGILGWIAFGGLVVVAVPTTLILIIASWFLFTEGVSEAWKGLERTIRRVHFNRIDNSDLTDDSSESDQKP
jgi:uncharacterized membrane protein (DUF485 family)